MPSPDMDQSDRKQQHDQSRRPLSVATDNMMLEFYKKDGYDAKCILLLPTSHSLTFFLSFHPRLLSGIWYLILICEARQHTHIENPLPWWNIYASCNLKFSLQWVKSIHRKVRIVLYTSPVNNSSTYNYIPYYRPSSGEKKAENESHLNTWGWIALSGVVSMATGLWWRAAGYLFFLRKSFSRAIFPSSHTQILLHSLASTSPGLSHSSSRWKITGRIRSDTFTKIPPSN